MKISIIIPTYNGALKVLNILKALELQTYKDFEVIVVVDGSTDNTIQLLEITLFELRSLKIVQQKNGGRSVSRNAGAKVAQGTILIFFDDDIRPIKECVSFHYEHHINRPDSVMVGSIKEDIEVLSTDIQFYRAYLSRKWEKSLSNYDVKLNKDNLYLTAANFSISKFLFWNMGGFDEQLTDAEDFDFAVKLYERNVPVFFNERAIGWHDDFITCKSYIKRQIQYRHAHNLLKKNKPELYKYFDNHQVGSPSTIKKIFFCFFSFSFWQYSIDYFNWLLVFPIPVRYKLYSFIISARSLYFPNIL